MQENVGKLQDPRPGSRYATISNSVDYGKLKLFFLSVKVNKSQQNGQKVNGADGAGGHCSASLRVRSDKKLRSSKLLLLQLYYGERVNDPIEAQQ